MRPYAEIFDQVTNSNQYSQSLDLHCGYISQSHLTPSGRVLDHLINNTSSYKDFSLKQAENHKQYFAELSITAIERAKFQQISAHSVEMAAKHIPSTPAAFRDYALNFQAAYQS
jgi:glutamate--cysteine ligase